MNADKNSGAGKIVGSSDLKVMAERFRERDKKAVDDFNEHIRQ